MGKYEIWSTGDHQRAIAAEDIKSRTPRNSAVIRLDDTGGKYVSFKMEFDR